MAIFSKHLLSGSTYGKQITVAATSSPGTTIHTAVANSAAFDEVWIWATNISGANVDLTMEWGGLTAADHMIVTLLPKTGRQLIVDGKLLQQGLIVKAFAGTTNVINLDGFINRIDP